MISVLIPLYQEDIASLLSSLLVATERLTEPAEIIISDVSESSRKGYLEEFLAHKDVFYHYHNEIKSRAENRNYLADQAKFDHLVFLDCDAILPDLDFLVKYAEILHKKSVICGGTAYQKEKPDDKNHILRWKYGTTREVRSYKRREENPYSSFSSFNFCIPAKIFQEIKFNETVDQYGHEDTFFGFELEKNQISILHIDNPLIHNGLESAKIFIKKTETGIVTLVRMAETGTFSADFLKGIQLWKTSIKLRNSGLLPIIKILFPLISKLCLINLKSNNPNIRFFDVYKLAYLAKIQG